MRILVTGTRGIPNIPGGIERHCEELYPRLVGFGVSVSIARRKEYITEIQHSGTYKGVQLEDLKSSRKKHLEAITHTIKAVIFAKRKGFKYIHIHAVGPGLIIPLARILGLRVVFTHHGPDYHRQKWGKTAKLFLRLGEWCATIFSNEIIVISNTINDILKTKYKRNDAHLIYNGVTPREKTKQVDYISKLGLVKQKYIIAVGRFVPEKGWHDLIDALPAINRNYSLVFIGDTDHPSSYADMIKKEAKAKGVVLTGFITGSELHQIYSHAALFVIPSYHEGLPIALLEAMSYNLRTVVSDIPANVEVKLPENNYYSVGNIDELAMRINEQLGKKATPDYLTALMENYDWDLISRQTHQVYKELEVIDKRDSVNTEV